MNGSKSPDDYVVISFEDSAVDVSNRGRIDLQLRSSNALDRPLVIDWAKACYADRLGLETVFDFLIERSAPVAFSGVRRDIEQFLWRLQILPLIPMAATIDEARALIEGST